MKPSWGEASTGRSILTNWGLAESVIETFSARFESWITLFPATVAVVEAIPLWPRRKASSSEAGAASLPVEMSGSTSEPATEL